MTAASAAIPARPKPAVRLAYLRWGLLALIQLALIAIPLIDRLQVQVSGTVVRMELVPVDPRDLLRGDYVVINLAITSVSKDVIGTDTVMPGDRVYVGLVSQGGGPVEPIVVSKSREGAGPLAIAGTVLNDRRDSLRLDYGIDAFFLPEGEGKEIEHMDTRRLLLEVSVAGDGRSLPTALLVDGKAFKSDSIF